MVTIKKMYKALIYQIECNTWNIFILLLNDAINEANRLHIN